MPARWLRIGSRQVVPFCEDAPIRHHPDHTMSDQVPKVAKSVIPEKDDIADFEKAGGILSYDKAISRPEKRIHAEPFEGDRE
jgi:hypothetical protein